MEFRSKADGPVDIVFLSGQVVTVAKGETFEATGDDAKGFVDSPLFTRTDEPQHKSKRTESED